MRRYPDHELIFVPGFAGPTPIYSLYFKEGQPGAKSCREMGDAACPNSSNAIRRDETHQATYLVSDTWNFVDLRNISNLMEG